MKQTLYLIYFNVSLLCVLLVGLEVAGQVGYLLLKGYPIYQSDQHLISSVQGQLLELHPFLVGRPRAGATGRQSDKVVTMTAGHTRWTGADERTPGAIRIAVVGGSTTFGARVSDTESWPARLQALLGSGFAVTNYGMLGYSSAESVIQMALIVPEARPDIVVFYEGWNDLHNYHDPDLGPDYYSHGVRQYANLDIQRPRPATLFAKLVDVSAICRLASALASRLPARAAALPPGPEELRSAPSPEPDPFVERIYRRNLATLKMLTRQIGAEAIFIPQVLDPSRFKGTGSSWWTPHIQNDAMPGLLGRMNGIMGTICDAREMGCTFFNDPVKRDWRADDFLDEGHFSGKGNDAFARLVSARILSIVSRDHLHGGRTGESQAADPKARGAP